MSSYVQRVRAKIGHDLLLLPGVAAVIRDEQGRLLLQLRSSGEGWSLPAGAVEPGETPNQAIEREVLEETGLSVAVRHVIGVFGAEEMPRLAFPYPQEALFGEP